ncbi:effector binding domain-containing protein [Paenibacillus mendelii]|uniref:Effector binding domain-containing protein n=1 Tax=Paenibacillus mendelii TaxID=206163 RepID=A0ABV6J5Y1_9BACL|nr:GyrI-like domain-containing protein [Paenibacillus mendelii]MCQ6560008.1 GyrI-like domain-containing protein [Paenibacillus mendelii]
MIRRVRRFHDSGREDEQDGIPESYRPSRVTKAFKVVQGSMADEVMEVVTMNEGQAVITVIERPMMKAVVRRTLQSQRDVRQAWQEVELGMMNHPDVLHKEQGLVFIPEWQWAAGVETLWVGVEVGSLDHVPEGFEIITIPSRTFARTTVCGDRGQMDRTYAAIWSWFDTAGYERDMSEGSYGYELNRLAPVNPFHIPADEINHFDFDVYAPIIAT